MTLLKHGVAAAITLAGALAISNVASAAPTDFIDNGHYTTDTNNGLDWLDVTISVGQSYNYVSSQFGPGSEYEGWRYATASDFNRMVTSWTGAVINDGNWEQVIHEEGAIDGLHFLLGSTVDAGFLHYRIGTYDDSHGHEEGSFYDSTVGFVLGSRNTSTFNENHNIYLAHIVDDDQAADSLDVTKIVKYVINTDSISWFRGHYLVRGTPTPVPVPAAVWLMGSGLLGLLGYSRHRKPTIAA